MADVMTSEITKTISGEAVNFYTPREQRIRSLKVYFSPKQAGTGTPSPENVRPISGWTGVEVGHCGKNLFDGTLKAGRYINGIWDSTNTWRTSNLISVKSNQSYCISYNHPRVVSNMYWNLFDKDGNWIQNIYDDVITTTSDTAFLTFCNTRTILVDNIQDIQLELGSEATDYTPYETKISLDKKYQEIAYLQSDGSQYIDLNFGFDPTDEIETRFSIDTSQITDKYIVSPNHWNSNNNRFAMGVHIGGSYTVGYGGTNTSTTVLSPKTSNDGEIHKWIYNNYVFSIPDILASKDVSNIIFKATTTNLRLFYGYNSNTKGKIASYHHKKTDGTEINLIPCYRISDKVAGMYDTVSKTFYTNSGTGEFITGPAVNRYDIDWGDDVGTVYGGYVDLVSGELVETYGKIELTGEENLQKNAWNGNGVYRRTLETAYNPSGIPFMNGSSYGNMLPYYNYGLAPKTDGCFSLAGAGTLPSYTYLLLYNSGWGTTPEEYKAALKTLYDNGTPLTIVAPLKTAYHQTHQLSPATLSTIARDNNFWSNADRIEIEYDYIGIFKPLTSRKNIMSGTPHLVTVKDDVVSFGTDMAADLKECKVYFKPKQLGEGDPSPDNVRPIEGWDGITVNLAGINFASKDNGAVGRGSSWGGTKGGYGNIGVNNKNAMFLFRIPKGQTFKISCLNSDEYWVSRIIATQYDTVDWSTYTKSFIGYHNYIYYYNVGSRLTTARISPPEEADALLVEFRMIEDNIVMTQELFNNLQISCVLSNYEPNTETYNGTSLTIQFPQTIYGGYVDLVKGEVVEEYTNVTGWTQYKQNNGFIAYRADTSNYNANNWLCNMIGEYGSFNTSNMTKNIIQNAKVGNYNYLALDKTANINDLVVVLPLKTPNTYSLTPQTITTIRGANTIWANSNDSTEVTYYTHGEDAYQHVPTSDAITSSDDFLLVTDDGYVIGTEDDFITY